MKIAYLGGFGLDLNGVLYSSYPAGELSDCCVHQV